MISAVTADHTHKALLSERINNLASALADGVYEREHTIKICLLSALAGESVFLLGPPGIAKSMIAKRLIQAFDNSSYFEYLMTRFSTPEEVFGPLSIKELKDNGRYVRLTDGYLPTAQVVFLDEIWKAGPAILNTLLTVVNEKTFKNGNKQEPVPMRLLISASNELPDEDSGLDALYDRMLVRVFVNRIQNKQNFKSMLTVGTSQEAHIPEGLAITNEEYQTWQHQLDKLSLSSEMFEKLYGLKMKLERAAEDKLPGRVDELYVSDRRWKKALRLLKASAFFNGRDEMNPLDLLLLQDCLWNSPESRLIVQEVIRHFALYEAFDQQKVRTQVEICQEELAEIQVELEAYLGLELSQETTSGLIKKQVMQADLSTVKLYKKGNSSDLVRLVLLQSEITVTDTENTDKFCRWVSVSKSDLERIIRESGGDAYGYVNQNSALCMLHFDLDSSKRLVIRDIANRSVLVTPITNTSFGEVAFVGWKKRIETAQQQLKEADAHLRLVKNTFHDALPHNFIDPSLPIAMETTIQQLQHELESSIASAESSITRFNNLSSYFAE
ncbi:ATPase RavA domain-containing protein [Vibrio sp. RC27]